MGSYKPTRLIKVGGQDSDNSEFLARFAEYLASFEERVIIVHGGGASISELERSIFQRDPVFISGKRKTDAKTLQLAEMVLCGAINKKIVRALSKQTRICPIGLSGEDARILNASADDELGYVAKDLTANPRPVLELCSLGMTPVIAPIALDDQSDPLNANADDVACALALALDISELIFLTNVAGVYLEGGILPELDQVQAQRLIQNGVISGGMLVKVQAALEASRQTGAMVRICSLESLSVHGGTIVRHCTQRAKSTEIIRDQYPSSTKSCLAPLFAKVDLTLPSGHGMYLFDNQRRRYLDFSSGIAVNALGHQHPRITSTLIERSSNPLHLSNLFPIPEQELLAHRLTSTSFAHTVFFSNSGTEANEAAIKFAIKYHHSRSDHQRKRIVAFSGGFHGRTMGSLALTEKKNYRQPFSSYLYQVEFLKFNDTNALATSLSTDVAAVIVEPIQGEAGLHVATLEFLNTARRLCTEHGITLIFDEVQCGLMRSGSLWAYETYNVIPDILTTAKPLGGGLPLGATLISREVSESLEFGDHGSTFGGNPLACSLALVVLEEVQKLQENVKSGARELARTLEELARKFPQWIETFRGRGLMWGIDFRCQASEIIDRARSHGLLILSAGPKTVRLLPPLICNATHIEEFGKRMRGLLNELNDSSLDSIQIRVAEASDLVEIFDLLSTYSEARVILPRTIDSLSCDLENFIIAEWNGLVVGCGSLKHWRGSIAEVRSLAVHEVVQGIGIGTRIIRDLLARAFAMKSREVFALTLSPEFFERHGFQRYSRSRYPFKEKTDCQNCTFSSNCNEIAVGITHPDFAQPNIQDQNSYETLQ